MVKCGEAFIYPILMLEPPNVGVSRRAAHRMSLNEHQT
jgi:hypothetical protein